MTDDKLDQILKQALAPKIDDTEITVHRGRKNKMRKIERIGKAVAAALAIGIIGIGALGYFDPVLAAKIPLIGGIFEQVEDDVRYSGDYASKASVLTSKDPEGNIDTSKYSVSDQGFTLTVAEVYCDGYSVFLTVNIEAEDADFTKIPKHYTRDYPDDRTAAGFYINGSWRIDGNSSGRLDFDIDGKVIDSHTFAGMLKADFEEKFEGGGELSLHVTGLGYDDTTMLDGEDMVSHWVEGNWNVAIPFEANVNDTKTIKVGEKKGEITLDDVIVSPYQVIVHTTTPEQQPELTDEMREKMLSLYPNMTDAEMFSIFSGYLPEELLLKYPDIKDIANSELFGFSVESYKFYDTIVFDQDGKKLYGDGGTSDSTWFAVQGKQIEALYIFIFDDLDDSAKMQEEGMTSSAADKAVLAVEIPVA